MRMARIRVLVVEDSATVGHHLCEVLAEDPELDVTGLAGDGRSAIECATRTRPNVITMDMMLPVVNGLAAIEHIMAHCPTPILVVSSSDNRSELFTTYDALAAGAVDALEKYRGQMPEPDWARELRQTVKLVSRIPVITHPRARLMNRERTVAPPDHRPTVAPPRSQTPVNHNRCEVIGLGASAGGPGAVVQVLRLLPADYPLPVLLVQHISPPFAAAYVDWLGEQIGRPASCAVDGEPVATVDGRVFVAPPDHHMVVRNGRLRLTADPARHSCRPSIDYLFESLAREYGSRATACLLTGMGRDGAAGLLALRQAGGHTIAQDEATSAVYGMPREAVALGAAQEVLGPSDIGRRLADLDPRRPGGPTPAGPR
jgi:two-component system, chemotaxis family, protein-glutamate methylesterase/glutaminase